MHEVFIISPCIPLKRRIKYIYFLIERHKTLDFFLPHSLSKTSTFQAITLKTITKTYWQFRYLKRQSVAPECMHGVSRVVGWCVYHNSYLRHTILFFDRISFLQLHQMKELHCSTSVSFWPPQPILQLWKWEVFDIERDTSEYGLDFLATECNLDFCNL